MSKAPDHRITHTEDGTVIIVDTATGKSASGRNRSEAEANLRSAS